ncbi:hypothetical protein [Konateibacter massiliensis]|uniref:hypothetical protein n=1 Tax=Konateibacter massiliensis TaxID=2002841 RepID=UPI000C14BE74|nr:hypothetical protein [Konateibacter massiliensis]
MPENDIYNSKASEEEKERKLLSQAKTKIDGFTKDILNKKTIIMYRPIPGIRFVSKQAYKVLKHMYKDFDKKLYADDKCIKCKQCTKY